MTLPGRPAAIDLVIDTSALIAMLVDEPIADLVEAELASSRAAVVSAASILEASMVAAARHGALGMELLDDLVERSEAIVMPVDDTQLGGARRAWQRFGRGNHPARLNFGDCFTYALAANLDVPVLCTGNDFAQTDLRVLPSPPSDQAVGEAPGEA